MLVPSVSLIVPFYGPTTTNHQVCVCRPVRSKRPTLSFTFDLPVDDPRLVHGVGCSKVLDLFPEEGVIGVPTSGPPTGEIGAGAD